jgi:hypothetical protein
MLSVFRFLSFRKSILVALPLIVVGAYAVNEATGSSGGVVGDSRSGCSSCHGTLSVSTVVKISTSATQIVAGQTYVFEFSVANPNEKAAGCDISVDNGAKLAVNGSNSGLWIPSGYSELTHTSPRVFTGDSAVWTFKYTAPTKVGTAHIYAAGNAVNLDGAADAADHCNTTIYDVNVVSAGVAPDPTTTSELIISPNPSQGIFNLSSTGMTGSADVDVSDPAGRIVAQEEITLGSEASINLSGLPNGKYFLSVHSRNGQSFVRTIVLQR